MLGASGELEAAETFCASNSREGRTASHSSDQIKQQTTNAFSSQETPIAKLRSCSSGYHDDAALWWFPCTPFASRPSSNLSISFSASCRPWSEKRPNQASSNSSAR